MHTTWYMSVDLEMTILVAPIVIFLLRKFDKPMVVVVKAMIVASSLYACKIAHDNKFIVKNLDM
jgi:hypothetical protein